MKIVRSRDTPFPWTKSVVFCCADMSDNWEVEAVESYDFCPYCGEKIDDTVDAEGGGGEEGSLSGVMPITCGHQTVIKGDDNPG